LNLRCFGHENHVSWSFYRFMLCDKRHCSQVLWFEAGSTTAKQAQLSQLLHRHTVPTGKKWWHLFDWSFSFYIVLLCLTSNSRSAKSKTWLRAVALLQT
jgi:hypothetical protein